MVHVKKAHTYTHIFKACGPGNCPKEWNSEKAQSRDAKNKANAIDLAYKNCRMIHDSIRQKRNQLLPQQGSEACSIDAVLPRLLKQRHFHRCRITNSIMFGRISWWMGTHSGAWYNRTHTSHPCLVQLTWLHGQDTNTLPTHASYQIETHSLHWCTSQRTVCQNHTKPTQLFKFHWRINLTRVERYRVTYKNHHR